LSWKYSNNKDGKGEKGAKKKNTILTNYYHLVQGTEANLREGIGALILTV
jgi:hypothetical protein